MKAALNLNLGQNLTLTPQLQQAIRLLQLSTLELNQEIQQAVETNPMLELDSPAEPNEVQEKIAQPNEQVNETGRDEAEKDAAVDAIWEDLYQSFTPKGIATDDGPNFENFHTATESLQEHLTWQMEMTPFTDKDRAIATAIIDSIDNKGILQADLTDIQQAVQPEAVDSASDDYVDLDEIEAVLHRIQRFDPVGVGARDLRECLLVQIDQLPADTPYLKQARIIIDKYLDDLGQRNYQHILKISKLSEAQLGEILQLIQSLNPQPGETIAQEKTEYIIPDVIVRQHDGRWTVELNIEALPRVKINQHYANMVQRADNSRDNTFLKNNLQEARWLIKSLQSRQETLLRVATMIVKMQQDFFEHGEEAMKAMVLHDIAEKLDLHESTISRVTTQKYMHTPRGVFELKYFFSSHVATSNGGECSSTAIRAFIKKLIAAEDHKKPLSDQKISELLKDQGINVARRTIAKYREALSIPPSNERKSILP